MKKEMTEQTEITEQTEALIPNDGFAIVYAACSPGFSRKTGRLSG